LRIVKLRYRFKLWILVTDFLIESNANMIRKYGANRVRVWMRDFSLGIKRSNEYQLRHTYMPMSSVLRVLIDGENSA